ncbi:MAG: sulfotransferase [Phormidesmis sp.]
MTINNFAIIIGAIKCGTTSLFQYLAEHPEIAACRQKEPKFFNHLFSKGFDYYQDLWNWNPSIHKVALEGTPSYTRFTTRNPKNAAENIAQLMASEGTTFKFIYILRDPIERIESHYNHAQQMFSKTKIASIDEGIDPELIEISMYAKQLEEYTKRFQKENILLLNFEELKEDPLSVLKKVCTFLEIDPNYKFKGLNVVYNSQEQRREIAFPGHKWLKKSGIKGSISSSLSEEKRQWVRRLIGREREKVKFSQAQRNRILEVLKDDLIQLRSTYGFDVNAWKNIEI